MTNLLKARQRYRLAITPPNTKGRARMSTQTIYPAGPVIRLEPIQDTLGVMTWSFNGANLVPVEFGEQIIGVVPRDENVYLERMEGGNAHVYQEASLFDSTVLAFDGDFGNGILIVNNFVYHAWMATMIRKCDLHLVGDNANFSLELWLVPLYGFKQQINIYVERIGDTATLLRNFTLQRDYGVVEQLNSLQGRNKTTMKNRLKV